MRWLPDAAVCPGCGYSWAQPVDDAIAVVADLPAGIERMVDLDAPAVRRAPAPRTWSQVAYIWHLVDVMSIGTERLWTIADDPAQGLRCWDENALAEVRQYERQSPRVGLRALRAAVDRWVEAALEADPDAATTHDGDGTMTAADVIRRNALRPPGLGHDLTNPPAVRHDRHGLVGAGGGDAADRGPHPGGERLAGLGAGDDIPALLGVHPLRYRCPSVTRLRNVPPSHSPGYPSRMPGSTRGTRPSRAARGAAVSAVRRSVDT